MITTTGTVTNIKVRQDGLADMAFVTLLDSQFGQSEQFIVWVGDIGYPTPFSVWIARSLVISLLRTALVNKLKVVVTHDDSSAVIRSVNLLAA
jgi:hypothetical protein